jgi:hypothetical protein
MMTVGLIYLMGKRNIKKNEYTGFGNIVLGSLCFYNS